MKLKKLFFILIPLILLTILAAGFFWFNHPVSRKENNLIIEVKSSESRGQLAATLKKRHLIRSAFILRVFFAFKKPKPGLYQLSSSTASFKIFQKLSRGVSDAFKVTFPEGFTAAQMALRLQKTGGISSQDFLKAAGDQEGYLFPDTYYFAQGVSPEEIIKTLKVNFKEKTADLTLNQNDVILASIVEREAKTYDERVKIATLYLNRLKLGMKLEADPTVRYGLDREKIDAQGLKPDFEFWRPLARSELKIFHPYNTYLFEGLPKGPISNPSYLSLKAVKNSLPDFPYFYFFHNKGGQIEFSQNFSEHVQKLQAGT